MTSSRSARRVTLGAVAATVLGSLVATPALAASPSYPVVCASPVVDAPRTQTTTFTLDCEDADGNEVDSYAVLTQPSKAQTFSVDPVTGAVSYRPTAAARGTDTFTFKGVVDGLGESAPTTATLTIANVRPACDTVPGLTVAHDRSVSVPLTCTDADGDTLTVTPGTTGAAHGAVTVTGGQVVYTPAAGYVGADVFTLRATDGELLSDEVSVAVSVTNARPTCTAGSLSTVHDRAATYAISCSDADGDAITPSVVGAAQHGTVSVVGGTLTYRPAAGYVGADTFSLGASDGLLASVPAVVGVSVTNAVPTCEKVAKIVAKGAKKGKATFAATCTDADGDQVTVSVAKKPAHGKVVKQGKKWLYVSDKGFRGKDTFALEASDGISTSTAVKVVVKVKTTKR